MNGQDLSFVHKGVHFKVVPLGVEKQKLERLSPLQIINPEHPDLDTAELQAEMQTAWEKDWSDL